MPGASASTVVEKKTNKRKKGKETIKTMEMVKYVKPYNPTPKNHMPLRRTDKSYRKSLNQSLPTRSQALAMMSVPSPSRAAMMAMCLANPIQYPPIRWPDDYLSGATSVAKPYAVNSATFSGTGIADVARPIKAGSFVACLSRNPLRSLIQYTLNDSSLVYLANFVFLNQQSIGLNTTLSIGSPSANFMGYDVPVAYLQDAHWGNTSYFHPHGQFVYAGEHKGKRGFWVDATTINNASIVYTASATVDFNLYMLQGGDWELVSNVQSNSSTVGIASYGYYAIQLNNASGNPFHFSAIISGSANSFGHFAMPGIDGKLSSIADIRVNSASLMLSCAASALNAAGTVAGVQLKPGQAWMDVFGQNPDPVTQLMENLGGDSARQFPLSQGIYGFHKPCSEHAFEMKPITRYNNYGAVGYTYPLIDPDGWLAVAAQTNLVDTSYPGGDMYLTAVWGVEFLSTDPWYGSDTVQFTTEEFQLAVRLLRDVEQWHENPIHFAAILSAIRSGLKVVLPFASTIAKTLGVILPKHAEILNNVGNGIDAVSRFL